MDQRFSYLLYLPRGLKADSIERPRLLVAVHDTFRDMYQLRHQFKEFANQTNTVVLLPVFPCGIEDREDLHNYKFILYHGIRFDLILKDMIEEVRECFRLTDQILMYGFSGGAQFIHRYLYLHPENISDAVIVAPGRITFLDPEEDYYCGIHDFEKFFGQSFNMTALKKIRVLLMVGTDDTEEIDYAAEGDFAPAIGKFGKNRLERVRALFENYRENGMDAYLKELPGISHEAEKAVSSAISFYLHT